jgi:hypothetical protein
MGGEVFLCGPYQDYIRRTSSSDVVESDERCSCEKLIAEAVDSSGTLGKGDICC